eukprot:1147095-Pelagomonas_calceolata.AAC.2
MHDAHEPDQASQLNKRFGDSYRDVCQEMTLISMSRMSSVLLKVLLQRDLFGLNMLPCSNPILPACHAESPFLHIYCSRGRCCANGVVLNRAGLSHGDTHRVANIHATQGHAAPQHVLNWAALSGLAAQCWLGCSTQRMSGYGPARTSFKLALHQGQVPLAQGHGQQTQTQNSMEIEHRLRSGCAGNPSPYTLYLLLQVTRSLVHHT